MPRLTTLVPRTPMGFLLSCEQCQTTFEEKTNPLFRIAKKFKLSVSSNSVKTKKLGHQFGSLYLTVREYECVDYLIRGKTAEEIAIILNISKRTVETHVQNIKRKMNCYNQFRLGYLLGRLDIELESPRFFSFQ